MGLGQIHWIAKGILYLFHHQRNSWEVVWTHPQTS